MRVQKRFGFSIAMAWISCSDTPSCFRYGIVLRMVNNMPSGLTLSRSTLTGTHHNLHARLSRDLFGKAHVFKKCFQPHSSTASSDAPLSPTRPAAGTPRHAAHRHVQLTVAPFSRIALDGVNDASLSAE